MNTNINVLHMLLLDCINEICQCLWGVQPHVLWYHLKNARHSYELFGKWWQDYFTWLCLKEEVCKQWRERNVWPSITSTEGADSSLCVTRRMALGLSSCWICFSSGTCGSECLQRASRWLWRPSLHGFRWWESKVSLTAYVVFGLCCT